MGADKDRKGREVIFLFDEQEQISNELWMEEFEQYLAGKLQFPPESEGQQRAAYCVLGNHLTLQAVVFFCFQVNSEGEVKKGFNLPLLHLAQQAGNSKDFGKRPVRKASRGKCPVPWHSTNLWDPAQKQTAVDIAGRIQANRLGVPQKLFDGEDLLFETREESGLIELTPLSVAASAGGAQPAVVGSDVGAATAFSGITSEATPRFSRQTATLLVNDPSAAPLHVPGTDGLSLSEVIRQHSEHLEQVRCQYQGELDNQRAAFVNELRNAQQEISGLQQQLAEEQSRTQRLQQMLRGDM